MNAHTRRRPRLLFVCGREPTYVRNALLRRHLAESFPVTLVASTSRGYPARFLSVIPRLIHAAKNADLIVTGFLGQPLAIIAATILRKPVLLDAFVSVYDTLCLDRQVMSPRSPGGQIAFAMDHVAMRRARLTLVDTESQRQFFASTFRIPVENIRVHYLGPDFNLVHGSTPLTVTSQTTVLHYGSFLPLHGVDIVIEAARLLTDLPTVRFRLIGAGPRYAQIRKHVEMFGLENVEFIPWLPLSRLAQEIHSTTIGLGGHFADNPKARRVIAGKTYQLLAAGKPTIVGACSANRELFRHGEHAEFVPMGDPSALAKAIRTLSSAEAYRSQLGNSGRALMLDQFDPRVVANDLREAVEIALARA